MSLGNLNNLVVIFFQLNTNFSSLLLRRTIIPNGNFIMFWEIGRAVFAFLTGMIYPQSVHMGMVYKNFIYYIIILDVFAVLDM